MTTQTPDYISVEELSHYQQESIILLDVRNKADYLAGHLPNAISIPPNDLSAEINHMDTDKHYIVICYHGIMAVSVMNFMRAHGLQASVLKGGMAAVI
ncbi:MAG: rhodanese-like domain-containing protein [Gammaproteobacteria bacterium]|nr:rhodanese-like domain-containing protein [Gammaproteobacteria bacterium]